MVKEDSCAGVMIVGLLLTPGRLSAQLVGGRSLWGALGCGRCRFPAGRRPGSIVQQEK